MKYRCLEDEEKQSFQKMITKRIYDIRSSKNISARKCSELMGVSSQYINQIETGGKMPSLEGLKKFCDVMNISLSDFFDTRTEYPGEQLVLLKYCNKLSTDEIEDVINIVKRLANNKK